MVRTDKGLVRNSAAPKPLPEAFARLAAFDPAVRNFVWRGPCPYCRRPFLVIGRPAAGGLVGLRSPPCCKPAEFEGFAVVVHPDAWPSIFDMYFAPRPRAPEGDDA